MEKNITPQQAINEGYTYWCKCNEHGEPISDIQTLDGTNWEAEIKDLKGFDRIVLCEKVPVSMSIDAESLREFICDSHQDFHERVVEDAYDELHKNEEFIALAEKLNAIISKYKQWMLTKIILLP